MIARAGVGGADPFPDGTSVPPAEVWLVRRAGDIAGRVVELRESGAGRALGEIGSPGDHATRIEDDAIAWKAVQHLVEETVLQPDRNDIVGRNAPVGRETAGLALGTFGRIREFVAREIGQGGRSDGQIGGRRTGRRHPNRG